MGLTVRHTTIDAAGQEHEDWAVEIPQAVEAEGGAAVDAYVAAALAARTASPSPTEPAVTGGGY